MPESGPLIFFDSGHYKGSHRGEITCHIKHVYMKVGIFSRYNGTASNLTARRFSVHWRLLDDKIEQDTEHIILGGSAICLRPHPDL